MGRRDPRGPRHRRGQPRCNPHDAHRGFLGGRLFIIWHADVQELWGGCVTTGDEKWTWDTTKYTISWTDPNIVILDRLNGSGMDSRVKGTITRAYDPGKLRVDSEDSCGWDEICGLVKSAYACDCEITENS